MNSAPQLQPPSPSPTNARRPAPRTTFSRFPATFGLIVATLSVFLAQWLVASIFGVGRVCGPGEFICALGSKINQAIAAGQLWRLVTPIFIHVDVWHIFVNMYSLYVLGPSIEQFYGTARMLILYMLSGITGVAFSLGFNRYNSVGASGAVFGLVGTLGVFLFLHRQLFGRVGQDQLRRIVIVTLLNLVLGMSAMIDNWGHLGGLLAGIGLGWFLGPRLERVLTETGQVHLIDRQPWEQSRRKVFLAVAMVAALSVAALVSPFNQ
ncbi:MAG: rhomboid family intramembrane serine protease [Anaerolineales bacterium]|nr:rhomboid family intramembrane serine protease [Anaerolineales bacterium]